MKSIKNPPALGKWKPTQFDHAIGGDYADWLLAPVIQTRDSKALEKSNFRVALKQLKDIAKEKNFDDDRSDVQVIRRGHWGLGWIEVIAVNPKNKKLVEYVNKLESSLADYPIIDEMDFSNMEHEEYHENWNNWEWSEFRNAVLKAFELDEEEESKFDNADKNQLRELYEKGIPSGEYYNEGKSMVSYSVDKLTAEDLEKWMKGI